MYFRPSPLSMLPQLGISGQSESEETQRCLGNDDPADVDGEDDDERCHDIGQDMADQNLDCRGAHGPGCQKIVILFDPNHSASDHSGADDAAGYSQHQDQLE